MSAQRYVLLRRSRESEPAYRGRSTSGERLYVEGGDAAAAEEARRSKAYDFIGPAMPMALIAPVRSAAAGTAGVSHGAVPWGIRAVGADTSPFTGAGVVVAVLDTGIDREHPAFNGIDELVVRDFTGQGEHDVVGHGTHCAATIFGRDVHGVRIGIARGVQKALIAKVIGTEGATTEHLAAAMMWAHENGANVISMSLAIDFPGYQANLQRRGRRPEVATSMTLEAYRANVLLFARLADFLQSFAPFRQPCMVVAATGNESSRLAPVSYEIAAGPPADTEGFIAVGALQDGEQGFEVADFSNTGAVVSAPGVGVLSAQAGGGVVAMDGTSCAVPHVAGVAALWAEKLRTARTFDVKSFPSHLLNSASTRLLSRSCSQHAVGAGVVRAPQS